MPMGRFVGLLSLRRFRLGLIGLCMVVLVGLAVMGLAQSRAAQAVVDSPLLTPTRTHTATATPTSKPKKPTPTPTSKPTLTPTTNASPTPTATSHPAAALDGDVIPPQGTIAPAPPWLAQGLAIMFLVLLGFGLIVFPIVVRLLRSERRYGPVFTPLPVLPEKRIAQLNQIAPVRKQPLNPEEMHRVREATRSQVIISQESTATLAAVRIVDGVPISMPITEAETVPQLPTPKRPLTPRVIESSVREVPRDNWR
jgi:hypothetical protein